jgi:hypothetical protein
MMPLLERPSDGVIGHTVLEALPAVPQGWAWDLRAGRLVLIRRPVTVWRWQVVAACLGYWQRFPERKSLEGFDFRVFPPLAVCAPSTARALQPCPA